MLAHPAHAALDCRECQRFVYNIDTVRPVLRQGKKQERAPGSAMPCHKCPKGSPERGERLKLNRRSLATLALYRKVRATHGRCLTDAEASDELLTHNLAALDSMFRSHEAAQIRAALSDALTAGRPFGG